MPVGGSGYTLGIPEKGSLSEHKEEFGLYRARLTLTSPGF